MQASEQASHASLLNRFDQLVAADDEPLLSEADVKKDVMQQINGFSESYNRLQNLLTKSRILQSDRSLIASQNREFEKLIKLSTLFLRAEGWYNITQLHAQLVEQLLIVEQGLYEMNNILSRQIDVKRSKFRQSRRKAYSDESSVNSESEVQPQESEVQGQGLSPIRELAKSLGINSDESSDVSSDENISLRSPVQHQNLSPIEQLAKSLDVSSDESAIINSGKNSDSSKQVAAVRVQLRHVLYGLTGLAAAVATYYGVKKGTVRTIYGPDRVGVVAALTGQ